METQPFHVDASEVGAEAGPLETAPEHLLLALVTETCQRRVRPLGDEPGQEAPDRLRTPDRHDRNALAFKVSTVTRGERLERDLVADPFDEHDRARVAHSRKRPSRRLRPAAGQGFDADA